MRRTQAALLSSALYLVAQAASAAAGLVAPVDRVWPQWQARTSVNAVQLTPVSLVDHNGLNTPSLLGDYYFDAPGLRLPSAMGGLRATSGMLATGLRGAVPGAAVDTQPYLGIGYTGLAVKGSWGVSADLGLALENPAGAMRLGRAVFGNQGFDSSLRELRLSPVLQLGVRYAF